MTTAASAESLTPPRDVRWNFAVLVGDVTCFLVGMAFLDPSTALPAIVEKLGGGPIFLGLILALRQGAYYLPPLFIAHALQGRERYKPLLLRVCLAGRVWLFAVPLALYFFGRTLPALALGILAFAYTATWLGDGAGGVPWTAIIGRAIPSRRRGALFATSQVLSAVGRLVVGVIALTLLGSGRITFPMNAVLLASGCAVFLFFSWLFLAALREPLPQEDEKSAAAPPPVGLGIYLRSLPRLVRARPEFARLALAQVLATAAPASAPFIVSYAEQHTNAAALMGHLPSAIRHLMSLVQTGGLPGLFLIVQTTGLLFLAPLWGWLTDRFGPKASLLGAFGVALFSPLCAFAAGSFAGNRGEGVALTLFLTAYFCFGAVQDGWVTLTNFLLEIVPEDEQPTYIALMSAASAPALLLPIAAGLLTEYFGPRVLFFAAFLVLILGFLIALTLPDTRAKTRTRAANSGETG